VRVGLVLGTGGAVGAAYHAGALAALEHDLGWDPRTADVIVGTSAGSLIGALLRRGVPASDLAAWAVEAPLSPTGAAITASVVRPEFDPLKIREFLRPPRVPHPRAVLATMRRPHRFRPMRALVTHMADGPRDLHPHVEFLGTDWPAAPTWICTVRRDDGRRTVFGRAGAPPAGLAEAVAASCCVPGYFSPVRINDTRYLDGGVKSPTNADVLRGSGLDLVIALSPMSAAPDVSRFRWDAPVRRQAGRTLLTELSRLRAQGTESIVFAPTTEVLAHVTTDFMSDEHRRDIVTASFLATGEQARASKTAALLGRLGIPSAAR